MNNAGASGSRPLSEIFEISSIEWISAIEILSVLPLSKAKIEDEKSWTRFAGVWSNVSNAFSGSDATISESHIIWSFLNHFVVALSWWPSIGNNLNVVNPSISDSDISVSPKLGSQPTPSTQSGLPLHSPSSGAK